MTYKLLVAATLSLGLGTAVAMAQTESGTDVPVTGASPGSAADSHLPMGWDGAIGDAFFSDPQEGTLRSPEEIQVNWDTLTEEQQAQVRSHCETVDTAAADTMPAPGDTAAGAETDDEVTTGSTTPDETLHTASIEQVCDLVGTM